jgi:hypothetical protein
MRRLLAVFVLAVSVASCGDDPSPTQPTTPPAPTQTRVISVFGSMNFGAVQLGSSVVNTLTVQNSGNDTLTVTGMTGSGGITAVTQASPTSFSVSPGGKLDVIVRFAPTLPIDYSGTISVNGNHTAGTNTIAFSGSGTLDGIAVFERSGTGDQVFDIPAYVTRLRVRASPRSSCDNFAARANGSLIINVILGTCSVADARTVDNTYIVPGGATIQTVISTGANWTFTEVR